MPNVLTAVRDISIKASMPSIAAIGHSGRPNEDAIPASMTKEALATPATHHPAADQPDLLLCADHRVDLRLPNLCQCLCHDQWWRRTRQFNNDVCVASLSGCLPPIPAGLDVGDVASLVRLRGDGEFADCREACRRKHRRL